jgi:NAD(P)-dependent dehydrogenase (short-subunit alcohol dehydrogenase family)
MKKVLITGGASGLGLAMAKYYAAQNWSVCIADIQDEAGKKIAAQLSQDYSTDCFFEHLDVTNESQWASLQHTIATRWKGLDALINNAGVASSGDIDAIELKDFKWTMDINVMGVVNGCHYFTPLLKKSEGNLINVASMAGLLHMSGMSAYNTSKAAVVALSETLYSELALYNVKVSVLCPAFFKTNLTDTMRSTNANGTVVASKLMAKSTVSADDIAKKVYEDSSRGCFMILTHKTEKNFWLVKRFLPSLYFRIIKNTAKKFNDKMLKKAA